METLKGIVEFLDKTLKPDEFDDSSNNGLQLENGGKIKKVCCGVDASMDFFEAAKDYCADLVICHHGISWNDMLKRITDLSYKHISFLIKNNMAFYASHLPLDSHYRYGNNAIICKMLGLRNVRRFGTYKNRKGEGIGYCGNLPGIIKYKDFKKLVQKTINKNLQSMDFGKDMIKSVAIVSGGASRDVAEAGCLGIDVYLSGEANLSAYNLAKDYGVNAVFAGHYATEIFGVRAISDLLNRRFKVKSKFIDLKVPY